MNPGPEEENQLRLRMLARRAAEPLKTKGKKRKAGVEVTSTADTQTKKNVVREKEVPVTIYSKEHGDTGDKHTVVVPDGRRTSSRTAARGK